MSGVIDYDERGPRGVPALVFLHGIGRGSDSWQPQFEAFAERYRCLAWNMPGYRGSTPLAPLTFAALAELAPKIVDSLLGEAANPAGVALAERCMAQVPDAAYRVTMQCLVTFDRRDQLPHINVPALLNAGERDGNAPPAMMVKMAGRTPSARYACIDGAGHLANLERPRQFNLLMRDFVANQNHGDGR